MFADHLNGMAEDKSKRYEKIDFIGEGQVTQLITGVWIQKKSRVVLAFNEMCVLQLQYPITTTNNHWVAVLSLKCYAGFVLTSCRGLANMG